MHEPFAWAEMLFETKKKSGVQAKIILLHQAAEFCCMTTVPLSSEKKKKRNTSPSLVCANEADCMPVRSSSLTSKDKRDTSW